MNRAPRAAALLLLALLVLPGCTEADPPDLPAMDPSTSNTPTPEPTTEPTTEPTVEPTTEPDALSPAQASRRLVRSDSGHFLSTYELDGVRIVKEGVYRISDASSSSDAVVSLPDGTELKLRALVVEGVTFGQVDNGGAMTLERCWFRYDDLPFDSDVAPEVGAVLGSRTGDAGVEADLATTAATFGTDFVTNLGITDGLEAWAPIELDVVDGRLTGWNVSPTDLLDAAAASGLSVPAASYQESDVPLTVRLDRFGEDVDLEAPARNRQLPYDPAASPSQVERAIARCEAR